MLRWYFVMLAAFTSTPAQACDTGPFRIHYEAGSAQLLEQDRGLLDYMESLTEGGSYIRLTGHTDTSGPSEENLRLSKRRVDGVRAYLIGLGMPPARILADSFGESRSITALDDGTSSSRHRYVLVEVLSPTEARKGPAGRHSATCGG